MKAARNFESFLKKYRIVALSIAFVFSLAVANFIQSFVNDILLPILRPLLSDTTWEAAVLQLGPVTLRLGSFLSAFFNLMIIATLLYFFVDKMLKWEPSK